MQFVSSAIPTRKVAIRCWERRRPLQRQLCSLYDLILCMIVTPVVAVFATLGRPDVELRQAASEICIATSCAFTPTEICHPMCDSLRPVEYFELDPGKFMGSHGTMSLVSGELLASSVALIASVRPQVILVASHHGLIRSVAFEAAALAAVPGLFVHELV
mmetsp:Transcript_47768/g.126428  ORF Transcript_47768/g.126428 Transcript_47768/m.126428 type:complete len:160 (+) Transcript_47768:732-1211(+)